MYDFRISNPAAMGIGVAEMMGRQRIAKEELAQRGAAQKHTIDRQNKTDDAAEKLSLETATKEQLGLALYVASKDPDYKRGRELLTKINGIDPNIVDKLPEPEVRRMYAELGEKFSGIKQDDPKLGQLYKTKGDAGEPIYQSAEAAVGKEAYEDPDSGGERNTQVVTRPVPGKPGWKQDYRRDPRSGARVPEGEPYQDDGSGGEGGSTAADSLIYRQAVGFFGGEVDPITGQIQILKTDAPKAQVLAARATELHKGGMSIAASIRQAADERPWEQNLPARGSYSPARGSPAVAPRAQPAAAPAQAPAAAAPQSYPEGTIAQRKNPDGSVTKIELRGGRWVPVGG